MNPIRPTSTEKQIPAHGYLCHRCGKKIPHGDNGLESRRLAIYCAECAAIINERMESRRPPAVRVVRVRYGANGWKEYRGNFPAAIIKAGKREIISDKMETLK